jgi:hypothetical protein
VAQAFRPATAFGAADARRLNAMIEAPSASTALPSKQADAQS